VSPTINRREQIVNNKQVAAAFVAGQSGKGSNFRSENGCLFSYRTQVAERLHDGSIAVNPRKYSQSTSRQMSHLYNALIAAGYEETSERLEVEVHNPGRWNGQGPAWGPEWSSIPFIVWERGQA
jgi:hypothetical protein